MGYGLRIEPEDHYFYCLKKNFSVFVQTFLTVLGTNN